MEKIVLVLLFISSLGTIYAQDCDVSLGLYEIEANYNTGAFQQGLEKIDQLLECQDISAHERIDLFTWKYQFHRFSLHGKKADAAILEVVSEYSNFNKKQPFEFEMLLAESSAWRKDTLKYHALLTRIKDSIFKPTSNEDHLNLGRYYFLINYKNDGNGLSNFATALQHFEKAKNVPVIYLGSTLRALGNLNRTQGDFDKSLSFYSREKEAYQSHFPENHFQISICNFNIGNIYYEQLAYQSALDHYLKTYAVWKDVYPLEHHRMRSLNEAIGDMYWELGQRKEALTFFNYSLADTEVVNNDDSESMVFQADSLLDTGNYNHALIYYQQAVSWREDTFGKDHVLTGACMNFVGRAQRSSGDIHASLKTYQKAIDILVEEMTESSTYENPDMDMNIQSYQYVLESLMAKGELFRTLYSETNDLTDLKTSLATFEVAVEVLEKITNNDLSEASRSFWTDKTISLIENSIEVCHELYQVDQNVVYLQKAFQFSERSKALLLLASLYDMDIDSFTDVPKDILQKEKEIKQSINHYTGNIAAEQKRCKQVRNKMLILYRDTLFSLRNEYDILIRKVQKEYPEYYGLKYAPNIASVEELQTQLLDADTRLINYFVGQQSIYVFSIGEKNISLRKIENGAGLVEKSASFFTQLSDRKAIENEPQSVFEEFCEHSSQLYTELLEPELRSISERSLIIIPDGNLSYLPFEILLKTKPQSKKRDYGSLSYLLKDFSVSYSPSASILLTSQGIERSNHAYYGFAPSYEQTPSIDDRKTLSQLEYSSTEIETGAALFGGKSWIGNDATEAILKEHSHDAGILHLAMHGLVEDEQPLLSTLFLESSPTEDGLLHTYEIYNMRVPAQLVILSACNTASGKLVRGEGIQSLERAFHFAGSSALLSTLWSVDDAASSSLSSQFLQSLKAGEPKDKALRAAKLGFLQSASPEKKHPFYWSSFKLSGDRMPLKKPFPKPLVWIVLGFVGIGVLLYARRKKASAA